MTIRLRAAAAVAERMETRRLFAMASWAAPVNGAFEDPTKWDIGVVPSAADDVVIVVPGNFKVSLTSSVTVASVRIGDASVNQGRTLSLEAGGSLTVTGGVELNAFGRLDVRTATLTVAGGMRVHDSSTVTLLGQAVVNAAVELEGLLSASAPGNAIAGALTTLPGSNISIGSSHAPAGLTVASGFVVNGFLGLQTLPSDPGVATLTIADGGTVTVRGGPDLNGLSQGTLEGAGRLIGRVVNAGEVRLDFEGVPLTIDGDYVQTSAGRLRAHVGRAAEDYIPSVLEVTGSAVLDGTLDLVPPFLPANARRPGDVNTVMTYATATGAFASVTGFVLTPTVGLTAVTVTGKAMPDPSASPDLLVGVLAKSPRRPLVGGAPFTATVGVVNLGVGPAVGTATFRLYASVDEELDAGDTLAATQTDVPVNLKSGKFKRLKFPFVAPTVTAGDYFLVAEVEPSASIADANLNDNVSSTENVIRLEPPTIDLAGRLTARIGAALKAGGRGSASLRLENIGNTGYTGPVRIALFADGAASGALTLITTDLTVALKAAKSKTLKLNFVLPAGTVFGSYALSAVIDPNGVIGESDEQNNAATGPTIVVG